MVRAVPSSSAPVLVVALGGNAISRAGDDPSVEAQHERTLETMEHLVPVIRSGAWSVVITHGNGPQVGNILLRSDLAAEAGALPRIPIDAAVADTQGAMGYMVQRCLSNVLRNAGINIPVVTVVTQVVVDDGDPAFARPAKPIGRLYPAERVDDLARHGWVMRRDPAGRGIRRVVPSPAPKEIVEVGAIDELVRAGIIVIACGGGGIPVVVDAPGSLRGVEAVVDKDLASSLLATALGATTFVILTEVDRVCLNFGRPDERPLDEVTVTSLAEYGAAGHFPAGSMGPKVEAATGFLRRGGGEAIITSPERLQDALAGRAGTRVAPGELKAPASS